MNLDLNLKLVSGFGHCFVQKRAYSTVSYSISIFFKFCKGLLKVLSKDFERKKSSVAFFKV